MSKVFILTRNAMYRTLLATCGSAEGEYLIYDWTPANSRFVESKQKQEKNLALDAKWLCRVIDVVTG